MQAGLEDDFLADLDDLGDEEEEEEVKSEVKKVDGGGGGVGWGSGAAGGGGRVGTSSAPAEASVPVSVAEHVGGERVGDVARLLGDDAFQAHLAEIQRSMKEDQRPALLEGSLEDHPQYRLVCKSNEYLTQLQDELETIHNFVGEKYAKKFPELFGVVPSAMRYMRTVRAIGNATDMTKVDLSGVLSGKDVMNVMVTGSQSSGRKLSEDELAVVLEGCDAAEAVADATSVLLEFVESRMPAVAPNLTALLGARVAAKLVAIAGGLAALAGIPGCNIKLLGQQRSAGRGAAMGGYSRAVKSADQLGVVHEVDLVQRVPREFKLRIASLLGNKAALAARIDASRGARDGRNGREFRDKVEKRITILLTPPPSKLEKPLPEPEIRTKKRRGGKRARKWRETHSRSKVQEEASRLAFGQMEGDDYAESAMGLALGRLQQGAGGAARVAIEEKSKRSKKGLLGLSKAARQRIEKERATASSGLASSLVFTPGKGTEMVNPALVQAQRRRAERAKSAVFDASGSFSVAEPRRE